MSAESSLHELDAKLTQFDAFITENHSKQGSIVVYSLLCANRAAASDICALRTCLVSAYIRQLYEFYGKNYVLSGAYHDPLFSLLRSEFGWAFTSEDTAENSRYLELLQKIRDRASTDARREENMNYLDSRRLTTGPVDEGKLEQCYLVHHFLECRDGEFSPEAVEAAKIASLLTALSHHSDSPDCPHYLIAVVPEQSTQLWLTVRKLLEYILQEDNQLLDFKISTVTVGSVTFANGWAESLVDYFSCRRSLIDLAYRHKFGVSGGDESGVPTKTRSALTFATIIFELMAHPARRSIVIDQYGHRAGCVGDKKEPILPQWARNGAFVVYNYARLRAILAKYSQGVESGLYPEMKPMNDLDDSVKTKIWQDVSHLIEWLSYAKNIAVQLNSDHSENEPKLPDLRNAIFTFARQFSRYYGKHRVLLDSVPFTPLAADALRTKIHVLSRLKDLFLQWFKILSIDPVDVV